MVIPKFSISCEVIILLGGIRRRQTLLRATTERKLWRAITVHVLKTKKWHLINLFFLTGYVLLLSNNIFKSDDYFPNAESVCVSPLCHMSYTILQ